MELPQPFTIAGVQYYNSKDLMAYNPVFYYGCKSKPRTIIEKKKCIDVGLVLVSELCENEKLLRKMGISEKRITAIVAEGKKIIQPII